MELFRLYLVVGGMPAAVSKYIESNNLQEVMAVQQDIIRLYERDIAQYDPNNKLYIEEIFNLIPPEHSFIESPKLFIPCAWGNGRIGEDRLKPFVPEHRSVCFETYLMVGPFDTWTEVENAEKYINTKFFHLFVAPLKISQHATQGVYRLVPLQNFTSSSDIDWNKSVSEIDQQLYVKYGLSEDEISFIESMIKPM